MKPSSMTNRFCVLFMVVIAAAAAEARTYGVHTGYLTTTEGEREVLVKDLVVITPPDYGPSLHDRIFNEKLTKEFTNRYEEKFGRTEQQRAYLAPNNNTYYNDLFGFQGTPQQTSDERRRFAEYMLRRLAEHHVESYAKSDPKARVVWEAKEKLSNVNLAVGNKIKVSAKYSISSNSADIDLKNPWANTRLTLYVGESFVRETIISISRGITKTTSAETHVYFDDGIVSLIGRKSFTPAFGASLTTSTYIHHGGVSRRESLYLAGVSYTY